MSFGPVSFHSDKGWQCNTPEVANKIKTNIACQFLLNLIHS